MGRDFGTRAARGLSLLGIPLLMAFQNCGGFDGSRTDISSHTSSMVDQPNNTTATPLQTFSLNTAKTRFNILFLEPGNLGMLQQRPGSATIRAMIAKYQEIGIDTLFIAYSELFDCFYYNPSRSYSFFSEGSGTTVNSLTAAKCGTLSDNTNYLDVVMQETAARGMRVILGLTRAGDIYLTVDIHSKNAIGLTQYVAEKPGHTVSERITRTVNANKAMAADLLGKYGAYSSFGGWYLTHETNCLDEGLAIYKPIAQYLKQISPSKSVVISPPADAAAKMVCTDRSKTYLQLVEENKNLIDVYLYQDAIGAGTYNGAYHYTDTARQQQMDYLTGVFNELKLIHAQTGTWLWFNTEAWRMNGYCNGKYPEYGCSYSGTWTEVQKQMNKWASLSLYKGNLMLNEGFLSLDFKIAGAGFADAAKRAKAQAFTNEYRAYLAE